MQLSGVFNCLTRTHFIQRATAELGLGPRLVINLDEVSEFDSCALAAFVQVGRPRVGCVASVVVVAEGSAMRRMLEITGVSRILRVYRSDLDACGVLALPARGPNRGGAGTSRASA